MPYVIENRGNRTFTVKGSDLISGGKRRVLTVPDVSIPGSKETEEGLIAPNTEVTVTDSLGEKLLKGWPKEIKLRRKSKAKSKKKE